MNTYEDYLNKLNFIELKDKVVEWIRNWFEVNGKGCNAVVGISGGKDSSVVAALCVEALGRKRVLGVLMPCGEQSDISDAYALVNHLNINYIVANIKNTFNDVKYSLNEWNIRCAWGTAFNEPFIFSEQALINLAPRIRMATLYAVSQSYNGRVANTCNLSEDWVGYSTRYGDSIGDFSPLSNLTTDEVIGVGMACGLPKELVLKVPADGLQYKTDEQSLGFTYRQLNEYIRIGICEDKEIKEIIDKKHKQNLFKLKLMDSFPSLLPIEIKEN